MIPEAKSRWFTAWFERQAHRRLRSSFDALHVANEGRFAAWVAASDADRALEVLRAQPGCADAVRIGTVGEAGRGTVVLRSAIGTSRILDMLSGEQLPRIC